MVKEFNIKSVTDAGVSEMQRALDQGLAMTFTRIVTGNGTYEEDEDVSGRTALKNQKNSYSFSGREDEVDGITLKAVLTNYDGSQSLVSTSYFINEIGIYISVGGTETLYAIAAVGDGNGPDMPAYNGRNVTQIKQDWFVACSNSANIEVAMTGGFALAEDLETEEAARIQADFENLYGLCTKNTTIGTNLQGNREITEVDTANSITAVTTIVQTSATAKTITTVVTPTDGDYIYTKTTVITDTAGGKTIAESYTKTAQGG